MNPSPRAGFLGLLILFAIVWFQGLDDRTLVRPDEGRYAEIAREMALSGDWVTPRLNGLKYFEKPPLQYWATAAAFRLFGPSHWAARWWAATTTFASLLLIFYAGHRLFKVGSSAFAAAAGCSGLIIIGHLNTLDAGLSAFLTISLMAFLLAQQIGTSLCTQRRWMRVVWVSLALSVLSKGLIGLVLPGAVLVLLMLIERDIQLLARLRITEGMAILGVIAAPWFIAVSIQNPEFAPFFFIHEHFDRFLTTAHHREGSALYFIPFLLYGMMPWTPIIVMRCVHGLAVRPLRWLLIWSGFVFLFFSFSHSKLPSYILPMFPALALFSAVEMHQMPPETLRRYALWLTGIGVLLFAIALIGRDEIVHGFSDENAPFEIVNRVTPWVLASISTFTAGAAMAAHLFARGTTAHGIVACSLSSLIAGFLMMSGHNTLAPLSSSADIITQIESEHGPLDRNVPFYSVQMYDQTVPFYLRRTVTLVGYVGEFGLGIAMEPHRWISQLDDWKTRWLAEPNGYAILLPTLYGQLRQEGFPMRILAKDPRRVIVSRP